MLESVRYCRTPESLTAISDFLWNLLGDRAYGQAVDGVLTIHTPNNTFVLQNGDFLTREMLLSEEDLEGVRTDGRLR